MSNGYGDFETTRQASMAAMDRLPRVLRNAVNYAVSPWAVEQVLDAWRSRVPARIIVNAMRAGDCKTTLRDYGPNHPEARA